MNREKQARYEAYRDPAGTHEPSSIVERVIDRVMTRVDFERFELLDRLDPAIDAINAKEQAASAQGDEYALSAREKVIVGVYSILEFEGVG